MRGQQRKSEYKKWLATRKSLNGGITKNGHHFQSEIHIIQKNRHQKKFGEELAQWAIPGHIFEFLNWSKLCLKSDPFGVNSNFTKFNFPYRLKVDLKLDNAWLHSKPISWNIRKPNLGWIALHFALCKEGKRAMFYSFFTCCAKWLSPKSYSNSFELKRNDFLFMILLTGFGSRVFIKCILNADSSVFPNKTDRMTLSMIPLQLLFRSHFIKID